MENIYIEKCVNCGRLPKLVHLPGGLIYAQCNCSKTEKRKSKDGTYESHTKKFHNPYDYLGYNERAAIESWNFGNRPSRASQNGKKIDI